MTISVHFNEVLTIGLCLIPGCVVAAILAGLIFSSWEIGALVAAEVAGGLTLAAGLVMTFIGIGMNLH
jgi:hypothetical protein